MMHEYHESLPGYSPHQILHDGCAECEDRGKSPDLAIEKLDQYRFIQAWTRAAKWNRSGVPDISRAEVPLLRVLWIVQVQLERMGVPIGELPRTIIVSEHDTALGWIV